MRIGEKSAQLFLIPVIFCIFKLCFRKEKAVTKHSFIFSLSLQSVLAQTQEHWPVLPAGSTCKLRNCISDAVFLFYFGLGNFTSEIGAQREMKRVTEIERHFQARELTGRTTERAELLMLAAHRGTAFQQGQLFDVLLWVSVFCPVFKEGCYT